MVLNPAKLRVHYSDFVNSDRILLTGHSHQAWPNVAREGLLQAYDDAALHVDDKWGRAWDQARVIQGAVASYLDVEPDQIALGQNTHDLVTRFLSGLDWRRRTVVTTDGEFHSMRRQLSRLGETGIRIRWVPSYPIDTLAERLADAIDSDTAAVMASTVLFQTATVVPGVPQLMERAEAAGCPLLLDAYHAFGAMPNLLTDINRSSAFVVGGGYKYVQWGEGCCWMRVPPQCTMRPIFTGWFSDFASLDTQQDGLVRYGETPADRYAGSTYDPASHYRAARVIRFFQDQGMTMEALRQRSLTQTERIMNALTGFEILTPRHQGRGGFVSVRLTGASQAVSALRSHGIFTDSRGDILRFGPAPYTTDDEIDRAMYQFGKISGQ
jgi:kynureninase